MTLGEGLSFDHRMERGGTWEKEGARRRECMYHAAISSASLEEAGRSLSDMMMM